MSLRNTFETNWLVVLARAEGYHTCCVKFNSIDGETSLPKREMKPDRAKVSEFFR